MQSKRIRPFFLLQFLVDFTQFSLCKFSGTIIIHALDEKARAYYNLESLWTKETTPKVPNQVVQKPPKAVLVIYF